jgi:hypothetical protein
MLCGEEKIASLTLDLLRSLGFEEEDCLNALRGMIRAIDGHGRAGEDDETESLGQRENEDDSEGLPGHEQSSVTDDETGDDDERESTEDIDDGHAEGTPLPPTELNGADGGEPEMPVLNSARGGKNGRPPSKAAWSHFAASRTRSSRHADADE